MLIHASCVAINHQAVVITGAPGSGKSDLALRLIDSGAELIADDQTALHVDGNRLMAAPPPAIAGLLEVRQIGILRLPYCAAAPVVLHVDLAAPSEKLERLPPDSTITDYLGCAIRTLKLLAFAASTPAKIRVALAYGCITDA